jgi:hypothetical protein
VRDCRISVEVGFQSATVLSMGCGWLIYSLEGCPAQTSGVMAVSVDCFSQTFGATAISVGYGYLRFYEEGSHPLISGVGSYQSES